MHFHPPQDRRKVEEQIEKIKESVDKRIKEESTKPIKYLTIMATPFAVPDSKYDYCSDDGIYFKRSPVDNLYGNFYPDLDMAPLERKPLYRKDGKIYVLSKARESKEDEETLSMYIEIYNETTGIIYGRIKLFDGGIVSHPSRYAYNYTVDDMFNVHLFRLDYWDTPYDSLEYIIINENGNYRSKEIPIIGSIYSFKVKTALSGNVYVVVWSHDMGTGRVIITILGFDQDGDLVVEKIIYPDKWLPSYDFAVNSDGEVYIIGQSSYENVLIKLDPQGNVVFTKDENDLLFDHGVLLAQIEADENGDLFLPGIGVDLIQENDNT